LTLKSDRPRPIGKAYSKDYHNAAMQMINNYAHVKHVGPLVPLFNSVLYLYEHGGINGNAPNVVQFIKNEINDKINQNGVKTFQKLDGALRFLRKQGSLATMGFAWKANVMNIAYGLYTNWREEGLGHRIKGNSRLSKNPNKSMDILKFADVVKPDINIDPQIKAGRQFVKLAFLVNKLGEMHVSSSQFLGYLTPEEWNSFVKKDGVYQLKEGVDKKAMLEKLTSYKNKVANIQGKYDEVYRRSFERGEIGGAASQYKKWVKDWWDSRFGREMINEFGESVRGSYMMVGKEAVAELKNDFSKENNYGIEINGGIPRIKNKQVAKNLRESMVLSAILIAMYTGDDEDKKGKKYHDALSLESALGNMLFIFDPDQAQYLVEHPAGAIGVTAQYLKALGALFSGDIKKAKKEAWKVSPYHKIVDIAVGTDKKK